MDGLQIRHLQRSVRRKGLTGLELVWFCELQGFRRVDFVKLTGHALGRDFG